MLYRALKNKTEDLPKWNGGFAERWLLLLNCYPLVDNLVQGERHSPPTFPSAPEVDRVQWHFLERGVPTGR